MEKLPPFLRDTAVKLHLRSFYFNRLNSDDTHNEAWAFGGSLGYRSGWLWETFALGAVGYTSQPLYAPRDTGGTNLLHPATGNPQAPILVLGQAYAQLRYKEYALLTGYRQLVDEGYLNPQDSRMVPITFEGFTIKGTIGPINYDAGYLTAVKLRQENVALRSTHSYPLVRNVRTAATLQPPSVYGGVLCVEQSSHFSAVSRSSRRSLRQRLATSLQSIQRCWRTPRSSAMASRSGASSA